VKGHEKLIVHIVAKILLLLSAVNCGNWFDIRWSYCKPKECFFGWTQYRTDTFHWGIPLLAVRNAIGPHKSLH